MSNTQEENTSQAGHILRLVIDEDKEEYNVFVDKIHEGVHLGFDNAGDARNLYNALQNLDGMNTRCNYCDIEQL